MVTRLSMARPQPANGSAIVVKSAFPFDVDTARF